MSISEAQSIFEHNRKRGLAALDEVFRAGSPPNPAPDGEYAGALIALDVAPGITQFAEWITAAWLPWKGKFFEPADSRGDNIFSRDSHLLAHLIWPLYRGYKHVGAERYRAFEFRTYIAPGLLDTDRQVLKIDYNLRSNPGLSVRRVLDELVQVDTSMYLGKAHLKWWWGKWQLVAYFSLTK
jgi:hypothetical protein